MVKNLKLGSDIFNVAVWSNREGKQKVHCCKRLLFSLLALIIITAQVQICYMIIKAFLDSIMKNEECKLNIDGTTIIPCEDETWSMTKLEAGLQKTITWKFDLFIGAVICFILTAYQVFDDSKQRIIVMVNERNIIKWMIAYISYVGNIFVATAVFFTILQQSNVNDLLCNFAGLLVIIQIDDFIGAWACEYLIDNKDTSDETFLRIKVTDTQATGASILAGVLMLLFAVWTSLFYKLLASFEQDSESKFFFYTCYSYGFFFLWPVFQLCLKCCVICCCKKPDLDKEDDKFTKMEEEMVQIVPCHDHDAEFQQMKELVGTSTEKLISMESQIDEMMKKLE